ncbi:hypothetical protein [Thiomonas delicata]|uniref:Uncharacterized protein n=1 Tax=Thiomonas delicata TaxID=364030 RepID=A0A238D986_THIDL|nr:hypothetical protein [Thiomonas delicata]SBP89867.1 hypothetical protein THIARS_90017 [Thiomonas delicata]
MSATEQLNEQCLQAWQEYAESADATELAETEVALSVAAKSFPNAFTAADLAKALGKSVEYAKNVLETRKDPISDGWLGGLFEGCYQLSVYGRALVSQSGEFGGNVPEISEQEAEDWL